MEEVPLFTDAEVECFLGLWKMKALGLSEALVLDVYNTGQSEKSNIGGFNAVKKFPGYEIGVYYNRDSRGIYKIISVWKRGRR